MKIIGDVSTVTTLTKTDHLTGETSTQEGASRSISVEDGPIVSAPRYVHAYTHFKVDGMWLEGVQWEAFGRAIEKDGQVGTRKVSRRYWPGADDAAELAAALQPILDATVLGGTL